MKNHANVAIIDPGITSFVFIFLFGVYLYKLIIIITMYFGRIGPISIAVAFYKKDKKDNLIRNPIEEISVG